MVKDEWRMMKDEEWRMMTSSCWGVLITDRRTDICVCRVSFATENQQYVCNSFLLHLLFYIYQQIRKGGHSEKDILDDEKLHNTTKCIFICLIKFSGIWLSNILRKSKHNNVMHKIRLKLFINLTFPKRKIFLTTYS